MPYLSALVMSHYKALYKSTYTTATTTTFPSCGAPGHVPLSISNNFWATVSKTVRPLLRDRCLVCLCVTLVCCGQMAGWIKATWYGGRPRPRPHCVRWGVGDPTSRHRKGPPTFRPVSIVVRRSPISATAELLFLKSRSPHILGQF